jgi:hypothetical protein
VPVGAGSIARPADSSSSGNGLIESLLGVNQTMKDIATAVISGGKVADVLLKLFLPSNMMRLLLGCVGIVFLFVGIAMLGREVRN